MPSSAKCSHTAFFSEGGTVVRVEVRFLEWASVALVYFVLARFSQTLGIPPGNVTPVWIPSGVCFAWALIRGPGIWPGVLAGAMIGNGWAYFDPTSLETAARAIGSGFSNGVGDALATAGAAAIITRQISPKHLFASLHGVTAFLFYAVLLGSLASAVFGVTGLWIFGFVETPSYATLFVTWFTGDAIGVLVLAPLLILLAQGRTLFRIREHRSEAFVLLSALIAVGLTILIAPQDTIVYRLLLFMVPPIMMLMSVRVGVPLICLALPVLSIGAIGATVAGFGPFVSDVRNDALIDIQLLIGTVGISTLYLSAGTAHLQLALKDARDVRQSLEDEVRLRTAELEAEKDRAQKLAATDELTGIANRRVFFELAERERSHSARSHTPLSVVMLDLDKFKRVNDTFGHDVGDAVLIDMTHTVSECLRSYDLFARVGGEEFAILLLDTNIDQAAKLSERIRCALESRMVGHHNVSYTGSFGVAALNPEKDTVASALKRADAALYKAKRIGRNRVEIAMHRADDLALTTGEDRLSYVKELARDPDADWDTVCDIALKLGIMTAITRKGRGGEVVFERVGGDVEGLTAYSPDELLGQKPEVLQCVQTNICEAKRLMPQVLKTGEGEIRIVNQRKTGEPYGCHIKAVGTQFAEAADDMFFAALGECPIETCV
ncbi:diguanylate cyclase [Roseibium sp.]|uniref:sensor domain-containing diguanylate cyclase n=1 Tax=Roseibium sp. TaxID=1936156 RepID=UPI003D0C4FB2